MRILQVYFLLSPATNLVKIGRTGDVKQRIKKLQHSIPDRLELLGVIPENVFTEEAVHRNFAKERRHGEWFVFSLRLKNFIAKHKKKTVSLVYTIPASYGKIRTPGDVGNLIQSYRLKANLSQQEVAELAQVSRQCVNGIERGKPRASLYAVLSIFNALKILLTTQGG